MARLWKCQDSPSLFKINTGRSFQLFSDKLILSNLFSDSVGIAYPPVFLPLTTFDCGCLCAFALCLSNLELKCCSNPSLFEPRLKPRHRKLHSYQKSSPEPSGQFWLRKALPLGTGGLFCVTTGRALRILSNGCCGLRRPHSPNWLYWLLTHRWLLHLPRWLNHNRRAWHAIIRWLIGRFWRVGHPAAGLKY